MLYYNKITDYEEIDKSEGQDCVGITNPKSRQCLSLFILLLYDGKLQI